MVVAIWTSSRNGYCAILLLSVKTSRLSLSNEARKLQLRLPLLGVPQKSSRIREGCPCANMFEFEWDHWPSLSLVDEYRKTAFKQSFSAGVSRSLFPSLTDADSLRGHCCNSKYDISRGLYDIFIIVCILSQADFRNWTFSNILWCGDAVLCVSFQKKNRDCWNAAATIFSGQKRNINHKDNETGQDHWVTNSRPRGSPRESWQDAIIGTAHRILRS